MNQSNSTAAGFGRLIHDPSNWIVLSVVSAKSVVKIAFGLGFTCQLGRD